MSLTGLGRAAEDKAAISDREKRWETAKDRGAIDFDEDGFPIQSAPEISMRTETSDWTPITGVTTGRTYKVVSSGPVEAFVGGSLWSFTGTRYLRPTADAVLLIRSTRGVAEQVVFEDLGSTARLPDEIVDEIRRNEALENGRLHPEHDEVAGSGFVTHRQ